MNDPLNQLPLDPTSKRFPSDELRGKLQEFSESQFGKVVVIHGEMLKKIYLHEVLCIAINNLFNNLIARLANHDFQPTLNLNINQKVIREKIMNSLEQELKKVEAITQEDKKLVKSLYNRFNDPLNPGTHQELDAMIGQINSCNPTDTILLNSDRKTGHVAMTILQPLTPPLVPNQKQQQKSEPLRGPEAEHGNTALPASFRGRIEAAIEKHDSEEILNMASLAIRESRTSDKLNNPLSLHFDRAAEKQKIMNEAVKLAMCFFIKHDHTKQAAEVLNSFFSETSIVDPSTMDTWLAPTLDEAASSVQTKDYLVNLIVQLIAAQENKEKNMKIAYAIITKSYKLSLFPALTEKLDLYAVFKTSQGVYNQTVISQLIQGLEVNAFKKFIEGLETDNENPPSKTSLSLILNAVSRRLIELKNTNDRNDRQTIENLLTRLGRASKPNQD